MYYLHHCDVRSFCLGVWGAEGGGESKCFMRSITYYLIVQYIKDLKLTSLN